MKFQTFGTAECLVFDSEGCGPRRSSVFVGANAAPDPNYPRARISLDVLGLGEIALTVQNATELQRALGEAIKEVVMKVGAPLVLEETD